MKRIDQNATQTRLPATERLGDALNRGSELRLADPSELPPEFEPSFSTFARQIQM
jgi:hypothetical protein